MSSENPACPGCGSVTFAGSQDLKDEPVILNYRYSSAEEARGVTRSDIRLLECSACGLIFNSAIDLALIPYDANYDNRQSHSPRFARHLDDLASHLFERHDLAGKSILEVGCGKGDFLKILSEKGAGKCVGYDTTCTPGDSSTDANITFFDRYVFADDIKEPFDAIICRHVVEHVAAIGEFLKDLFLIAKASGDPVVLIETPRFEWIAEHVCFWDVFYEHCNYFTMPCLARLCRAAGFQILDQREVFDSQYQLLELAIGDAKSPIETEPPEHQVLSRFSEHNSTKLSELQSSIEQKRSGKSWAIWGAGAKGVTLANRLNSCRPDYLIDSNPGKQGCFIPGAAIEVISPMSDHIAGMGLVVISNPNYEKEITEDLEQTGFNGSILTI